MSEPDVETVPQPAAEPGANGADDPKRPETSTTVGTGSYVAVSCTLVALLVTAVILAILFLGRWLS